MQHNYFNKWIYFPSSWMDNNIDQNIIKTSVAALQTIKTLHRLKSFLAICNKSNYYAILSDIFQAE